MNRNISTAAKAGAVDVLAILVFVVLGRRSHDESESLGEVLKVFAPFAIALAASWVASRAWLRPLDAWSTGIALWLGTAGGGLLLRRFVFQRSTAFGFVIVGAAFLLGALVGWRLVAEWWRARKSS